MKKSCILLFLLISATALYAQSADNLSDIIKTKNATYGQVAYLTGVYQGTVQEGASFGQAFDLYKANGLISQSAKQSDVIPLQEVAFLCARATGLKGGLFYSIFHNSRYAYKELKAKKILPFSVDPGMTISGRDAIALLNGCIGLTGGNEE